MDIYTAISDETSQLATSLDLGTLTYLVRTAISLGLMTLLAVWAYPTLAMRRDIRPLIQVAIPVVGLTIAMLAPLQRMKDLPEGVVATLFVVSLFVCTFLPGVLAFHLVRTRGRQRVATIVLYAIIGLGLAVQLTLFKG